MSQVGPDSPRKRDYGTERSDQITIDCAKPDTMARFRAPALGYELERRPPPHTSWKAYWISVGVPEDLGADLTGNVVSSSSNDAAGTTRD